MTKHRGKAEKSPSDQDSALLDILANVDAMFVPVRDQSRASITRVQFRRHYLKAGADWFRRGGTVAIRKSTERVRAALERAGLVELVRRPSERAVGVRLTEAGDTRARGLAGLPTFADALAVMQRIHALRDDPDGCDDAAMSPDGPLLAWSHETTLVGEPLYSPAAYSDAGRPKLVALEEKLLPAMTRGLVKSAFALDAGVWYALTPAGGGFLEAGAAAPRGKIPSESSDARGLYNATLRTALEYLNTAPQLEPRDIYLPLLPQAAITRGQLA